MRDLVRARATAVRMLGEARQHLQGFLLRHERVYQGPRAWTLAYRRWLTTVRFEHPAQQIVLQDYIHAVQDAEARCARLTGQIEELLPSWSMAPVVAALQAMRGVADNIGQADFCDAVTEICVIAVSRVSQHGLCLPPGGDGGTQLVKCDLCAAWSGRQPPPARRRPHAGRGHRPIPAADIADTRLADWRDRSRRTKAGIHRQTQRLRRVAPFTQNGRQ